MALKTAEASDGFASLAQAFKRQVNSIMGEVEVKDVMPSSTPGEPVGIAGGATIPWLPVLVIAIGLLLCRHRLLALRKQWYSRSEDVSPTEPEKTEEDQGPSCPNPQVVPAPQSEGLSMDDLQKKHEEELRARDAKIEELQLELREKTAESLELWEDAKRQRKEANRLQSFAISATNSLRKLQREVNRLNKVIAQQKLKEKELQEQQRAGREVLLLKELDLARREAEVSSLAQAEQDELAQLREWLAAPEGAKDEHRLIAGLRDEVKEWQETYKKEKASWMRAIVELTKQRDQHVCRADLFAKQLGQWREIFPETDYAHLGQQDWDPESDPYDKHQREHRESCQSSPQVFHISSPRSDSEARSSNE